MKRLADVSADVALGQDVFVLTYPDPVLVFAPPELLESEREFRTKTVRPGARQTEVDVGLETRPELVVLPLRKREGAAYAGRISIGRTGACDVTLGFDSISKFHAYLTWNDARTVYSLADGGSTNGTRVDGQGLTPKTAVELPDRSVVAFGRHHFRFHTPAGLFLTLAELAGFGR